MLNFVLFVVALLQLLHIQHGFQLNHGKRMNLHSIDMSDNNNNKMNLKKRLGVILTATRLGIPTNILSGTSLQNSFKKLIPTTAIVAANIPRSVSAAVPFIGKKYTKLDSVAKLSTTPVFYVCNSGGHPYLQEDLQSGDANQRIIVYFMSSEDASDYLNEMAQGNPYNVNEFRVMTSSMEKIMNKIKSRKQSRKIGRYEVSTIYRIQPSSLQCQHADDLLKESSSSKKNDESLVPAVPTFTAKGMVVERPSGEKVLPYYFAYEDLLQDWEKTEAKGKPDVKVVDLAEAMCLSEVYTDRKDTDNSIGFVPPRGEINLIKRYYRGWGNLRKDFQRSKIIGARRG